jgi:hypothetical protein
MEHTGQQASCQTHLYNHSHHTLPVRVALLGHLVCDLIPGARHGQERVCIDGGKGRKCAKGQVRARAQKQKKGTQNHIVTCPQADQVCW